MDPRRLSNRVPAWMLVAVVAVGVLAGGWWVAGGSGEVPTATADHPAEPPFPETLNSSTSISYEVIGVWSVTVCGDGTVHYRGHKRADDVKTVGYVTYSISKRDVRELLVEKYERDYFALDDSYTTTMQIFGWSGAITNVTVDGDSHEVFREGAEPGKLRDLEDRIMTVSRAESLVENEWPFQTQSVENAPDGCE